MVEISKSPSPILSQRWLVAPLLAAIYPVLSLYTQTLRDANVRDAVVCGIFIVLPALAVAFLFRLVFRIGTALVSPPSCSSFGVSRFQHSCGLAGTRSKPFIRRQITTICCFSSGWEFCFPHCFSGGDFA